MRITVEGRANAMMRAVNHNQLSKSTADTYSLMAPLDPCQQEAQKIQDLISG
jgi:hypothetical protein